MTDKEIIQSERYCLTVTFTPGQTAFVRKPVTEISGFRSQFFQTFKQLVYLNDFFNPLGNIIASNTKISNTLNSIPFLPPPTTNQPSG